MEKPTVVIAHSPRSPGAGDTVVRFKLLLSYALHENVKPLISLIITD